MSEPFRLYGERGASSVSVTRFGVSYKGKGADLRAVLDWVDALPDHTFEVRPKGRKGAADGPRRDVTTLA